MTKKIRTTVTTSAFQPMLVSRALLDPSLKSLQERVPQRLAPKPSFSVHQRVAPPRVTSFASRRRNK